MHYYELYIQDNSHVYYFVLSNDDKIDFNNRRAQYIHRLLLTSFTVGLYNVAYASRAT